jgi:hypothetical protein
MYDSEKLYLSKKDILERGWTDEIIETFLPKACRVKVVRGKAKNLYHIDRILFMERSYECGKRLEKIAKRTAKEEVSSSPKS